MTTTTLSSKKRFGNLLRQMLRRNLSTSLYLFAIMFIFFPLQMFFETQRELNYIARNGIVGWTDVVGEAMLYTSVSAVGMVAILLLSALIVGLVQCSYLHNKRAVDLYHSLPVTRTQIMLSGFVSSFVTVAVPYVINYFINIAVVAYRVRSLAAYEPQLAIPFGEVAWDFFGWLVTIFAVLAIVNFVATQVGSVFENFVFVGELLAAPTLMFLLNNTLFDTFLTGYVNDLDYSAMLSLTPATFMAARMSEIGSAAYYNIITLLWLVLGALILWAAIWLYHRRRSEIAETSGCKGILGIIFSTVAVYLAAPVVGAIIYSGLDSDNKYVYVIGVVLGAVLSFLLVEAVLNRGFAGIRKHLPQGAAMCALVIAVAVIITTGGLGYETRIPNPDKVDSVTINSRGWYEYAKEVVSDANKYNMRTTQNGVPYNLTYTYTDDVTLTDKQAIERVTAVHSKLIPLNQKSPEDDEYWSNYLLSYRNGNKVTRRTYDRTSSEIDGLLTLLEDTEAFQREANPVLRVNRDIINKVVLHDNLGFASSEVTDKTEIAAILDALGKDSLEQGTAPYVGGEQVVCYVYVDTPFVERYRIQSEDTKSYEPQPQHFNSFSMPVFASYKHTLAQLGSKLPAKASPADVDEIGLCSYYDYSGSRNDRFVSNIVSKEELEYSKSDIDTYISSKDLIEYAAENMINTAFTKKDGYVTPLYCTFFKGDTSGITVMLDADSLPSSFFDSLSDQLKERYRYQKDMETTRTITKDANITIF